MLKTDVLSFFDKENLCYLCLSFLSWQIRIKFPEISVALWDSHFTVATMLQVQYQTTFGFSRWLIPIIPIIVLHFSRPSIFCCKFRSLALFKMLTLKFIQNLQEIVRIYPFISRPAFPQQGMSHRVYSILLLFQVFVWSNTFLLSFL